MPENWITVKKLSPLSRLALIVVIAFATWNSAVTALVLPLGAGPDEFAHLDHIFFIATEHRIANPKSDIVGQIQHPPLPYAIDAIFVSIVEQLGSRMGANDWRAEDFRDFLGRRTKLDPNGSFSDRGFTASQEELERLPHRKALLESHYWPMIALRFVSVILGIFSAFFVLSALRSVFPANSQIVAAAACSLFLLPGWFAHFAVISNDPWLTFFATWLCAHALKHRNQNTLLRTRTLVQLGVLLGICFLIKLHSIGIAFFLALLIWTATKEERSVAKRLLAVGKLAVGPIVIAGWWHVRQIVIVGGLLSLDYHAVNEPFLFRLLPLQLVEILVIPHKLAESFCGIVTVESLRAPPIFFVANMGLAVWALVAVFLPRSRRSRSSESEESQEIQAPVGAALLSLLLLLVAILIANRHYIHIHGRYFYGAMVPLMILIVAGTMRLAGKKTQALFTVLCVNNFAFTVFTLYVTVFNYFSIPIAKVDRGHVVAYYNCGHGQFDDNRAGGRTFLRNHRSLGNAIDSQRLSVDNKIAYKIKLPDGERPYQVRVRYPAPLSDGRGEIPRSTGISLFADGHMVHGPISLWVSQGDQVHPLPRKATADGEVTLTWRNEAPNSYGVSIAEIWVEEAWVSLQRLQLQERGETVAFTVKNIDQMASHSIALHVLVAGKPLATEEPKFITLDAEEGLGVRIPLGAAHKPEEIEVVLVQADRTPYANVKLAYYRTGKAKKGGRFAVPDVETLMVLPGVPQSQTIARMKLKAFPLAKYTIQCTEIMDKGVFTSGLLTLEAPGSVSPWQSTKDTPRAGVLSETAKFQLQKAEGTVVIQVGEKTHPQEEIHLDRLIFTIDPKDPSWGWSYLFPKD